MKPALIDTDILSYFFRNQSTVVSRFDQYLREFGMINISVVTYYEVLNGLYFKDAKKQLAAFERFVELNQVLPLTENIAKGAAKTYAQLRSQGLGIGHNDTLIAGTALEFDLRLITNNVSHFTRVPELEIENWMIE